MLSGGVKTYNFIKKETLTQVFFFEFCKISKNTFFTEHFLVWLFICCKTKLKKNYTFWKIYLCFLQNIYYLQKKIILYGKKVLYWFFFFFFFFTEKAFFTENVKNMYLIWEIFFYPENIYSFCKKNSFDHKKYTLVKTSWWTQ